MEKEVHRTPPLPPSPAMESYGTIPLETDDASSSTSGYIYSSRDEQVEGGGASETETKADKMSDDYSEEEFSDAKDVRVPVNGQVVNMPITSSGPNNRVSVQPVGLPVEGVVSSSPVNMAMSGPSSNNVVVSLPSTSSSCPESSVGPVHKSLSTPLSVTLSSTSSCNSVKSAKNRTGDSVVVMPQIVSNPSYSDSAITLLTTVTSSANLKKSPGLQDSTREKVSEDGNKVSAEFPYTCPVCQEPFKSKRSFNAHIIVHCQLVNGSSNGPKRSISSSGSPSPDKKRIRENAYNEQLESGQHGSKSPEEDASLPLDLSCRGSVTLKEYVRPAASSTPENKESPSVSGSSDTESKGEQSQSASQEIPPSSAPLNQSVLSDRGPLEDENENLVNEARERENSFFNTAQNEQYLTEDSTGLDPPPPLPLYGSGGNIRRIRVSSDDGPPMVYSVRLHAEQVVVSRILGVNEETGDKMELYKCFMCSVAFPSISRLQAHLSQHKQRFVCSKCSFSCDSRVQFSHHVQREHLSSAAQSRSDGSLRHLIKRDRRKKGEDDSPTPSVSPVPLKYPESRFKDVLKETANKLITSSNIDMTGLSGQTNGLEITLTGNMGNRDEGKKRSESKTPPLSSSDASKDQPSTEVTSSVTTTTYTTNLTRIIAASLDSSTRGSRRHPSFLDAFRNDELEPGEIRLDRRTKIIDDGESGRRLVITDDQSEEGLDHSPHFSNYAPRLNIVQEPIDRDKALIPITDDIGRTFFECPYCHKLFGSTSDMNRHLDFHEDLRPYNCEYCDYSARTNSQLKVHKMRHEGIKLYSCDVCNYNGVTQSDLNRHKKTQSHIARSQNVCSMCGLGFYTASQKQVHVVQCHPEVEGASSLIQMSLGPPVAPLMTGSEFSTLSNSGPSTAASSLPQATATAQ